MYPVFCTGEEKGSSNTHFLLWLTSRWPWDKRLVVPGLTGLKSLCVHLETQEIYNFSPLVNRRSCPRVVPTRQKVYVFNVYVPFSCPTIPIVQKKASCLVRHPGGRPKMKNGLARPEMNSKMVVVVVMHISLNALPAGQLA